MDQVNYLSTEDDAISLIEGNYEKFAFSRHYHLDYHFGLITSGQQKFQYRGTTQCAGGGELIIMPPDELHDGYSVLDSGYHVRVFAIHPDWFDTQLDLTSPNDMVSFQSSIVRDPELFAKLVTIHQLLGHHCGDICQLAQDCLPLEGFGDLVNRYGKIVPKRPHRLGKKTLDSLREYLMAHLDQPIRLKQLADICHLTPTQFQRHFKATTGMTPYAWLSRLRLEQAMKLLKSKVAGTDVALQVGFYDQAHFSKAFKHSFGVRPSDVR